MLSLAFRSLTYSYVKLEIILQHPQHLEIRAFSPKYEITKFRQIFTVTSSHLSEIPAKWPRTRRT